MDPRINMSWIRNTASYCSDATEIGKYLIQWQVAAEYPGKDHELMELTLENKRT
jgi:hypothetical protein